MNTPILPQNQNHPNLIRKYRPYLSALAIAETVAHLKSINPSYRTEGMNDMLASLELYAVKISHGLVTESAITGFSPAHTKHVTLSSELGMTGMSATDSDVNNVVRSVVDTTRNAYLNITECRHNAFLAWQENPKACNKEITRLAMEHRYEQNLMEIDEMNQWEVANGLKF